MKELVIGGRHEWRMRKGLLSDFGLNSQVDIKVPLIKVIILE